MKYKILKHFPFKQFIIPGKVRYFIGRVCEIPNINRIGLSSMDYGFKIGISFSNGKEGKELFRNALSVVPGRGMENDFSVHANRYFDFMIKQLTDQFKDK